MRISTTAICFLLAGALEASAGSIAAPIFEVAAHGLHRRHAGSSLRREALDILVGLHRRQGAAPSPSESPALPTPTPASGDASTVDLKAWEAQTSENCMKTVMALNGVASNPSGLAVCYNLPFLDNSTGVFEAELRIYNVSAPTGPWVGVGLSDISMTLSYLGATVQHTNKTVVKRDVASLEQAIPLQRRQSSASMPQALTTLSYVGQINNNVMGPAMTSSELQKLLIPMIELSANSKLNGAAINAVLSSRDASFVNGIFSTETQKALSPSASASLAAEAAASASAQAVKAAPFVLPGKSFGIFPVGGIISLVWTVAFLGTVGMGTVGRIQFREQYRRRVKRGEAMNMSTI